jgi:hypothetical protein
MSTSIDHFIAATPPPAPSPARSAWPMPRRSTPPWPPRRPPSRPGPTPRRSAARASCSSSCSCSTSTRTSWPTSSPPSTARSSPTRRAKSPRHRHRRVRLRHSAAAQGRLHRPGLHRHRQLDPAPAAGRGGRHHAVQLPGDGADVDVPGGHCRGQHLRAQAQPDRPEPSLLMAELLKQAGLPDGVFNVCRATRRRSTRCSSTRT